jgi:hypothetical protein
MNCSQFTVGNDGRKGGGAGGVRLGWGRLLPALQNLCTRRYFRLRFGRGHGLILLQPEPFQLQFADAAGEFFNPLTGLDCAHDQPDAHGDGNAENQDDDQSPVRHSCFLLAVGAT